MRNMQGWERDFAKTSQANRKVAHRDLTGTKTLISPSWSDDEGKIALALLTKPEVESFWSQSLEEFDTAQKHRWERTWTLFSCATLRTMTSPLRQRFTQTYRYMAIALMWLWRPRTIPEAMDWLAGRFVFLLNWCILRTKTPCWYRHVCLIWPDFTGGVYTHVRWLLTSQPSPPSTLCENIVREQLFGHFEGIFSTPAWKTHYLSIPNNWELGRLRVDFNSLA